MYDIADAREISPGIRNVSQNRNMRADMPVGVSCYQNRYGSFGSRTELAMLAGSHWGRRSLAHTFNKCILMTVDRNVIAIFQGSQLIEKTRPEKGFFIKSKKRYLSPKDGREHSKFSWEPVTVGDLWVDETDRKCQMHFVVYRSSGSIEQVDQPISRQSYTLFGSYKLDAHRVDLIDKVLRENRTGLRIRKWTATEMLHLKVTKRLMDELLRNAEKCGQNLSQYCTTLLSGKHPRAAFTEEELDLLRNLKKSRGDVRLQFNAMVAEFAHKSDEERFRAVIYGKSFDWWREHLITALEFFDRMRDRTLNMGG